jgi:hypothetical protein
MKKWLEYLLILFFSCSISVGVITGVLYGAYDKEVEEKIYSIVDSYTTSTTPTVETTTTTKASSTIQTSKTTTTTTTTTSTTSSSTTNGPEESDLYTVNFGPLGKIQVRNIIFNEN